MTPSAKVIKQDYPCCGGKARLDGLNEIGDVRSRKCKTCGACYRVTLVDTVSPVFAGVLKLEWKQTRKGVEDENRPRIGPTKRRGKR